MLILVAYLCLISRAVMLSIVASLTPGVGLLMSTIIVPYMCLTPRSLMSTVAASLWFNHQSTNVDHSSRSVF